MKTLTITKPNHRHGSKVLTVGDELSVDDDTAAMLVRNGIAEEKKTTSAKAGKPEEVK